MNSFNKPAYRYTLIAVACATLVFALFLMNSKVQQRSGQTPPSSDTGVRQTTVSENITATQTSVFEALSDLTNQTIAISIGDIVSTQPSDTYLDFTTGRKVEVRDWAAKRDGKSVSWIGIADFDNGRAPITITVTKEGHAFASVPTEQGVFWGTGELSNLTLRRSAPINDRIKESQVLPTKRAVRRGTAVSEICVNC